MRPAGGHGERSVVAVALPCIGLLCLVGAAYLYSSAVPIEDACLLAGDAICESALRRVWMAGGMATAFVVITGFVGVKLAFGAGRNRQG